MQSVFSFLAHKVARADFYFSEIVLKALFYWYNILQGINSLRKSVSLTEFGETMMNKPMGLFYFLFSNASIYMHACVYFYVVYLLSRR